VRSARQLSCARKLWQEAESKVRRYQSADWLLRDDTPEFLPDEFGRVKYWEIIDDNLSKAGWSWGCVSAVDSRGLTIWIADAHRGDGKRFIVRADEKLTAFFGT